MPVLFPLTAMTLSETLKAHTFTSGLTDSQLAKLIPLAHEVSFREDQVILAAGQQSKHFYLLLSGSACIEVGTQSYVVWVQILNPGDAFGWSALLEKQDTLFQVRAREKCRALCLDGERLSATLHSDSDLAAELLRRTLHLVAGRVQATEARLGEMCGIKLVSAPR
jgi:CRP/FNR family transcriptional regulator, cyclic AMP receptor protein